MPKISRPKVVIVGAGFGGLKAARLLARAPIELTVIDRNNYHLFQPLLYQVATAGLSPADIAMPIRSVLHRDAHAEVLMGEVTGVDVDRHELRFFDCTMERGAGEKAAMRAGSERSIHYDYLIIATGARHSYFGKAEWEKFAPGLKSIEDATSIRTRILLAFERAEMETDPTLKREALTFAIVGAGPTGVEVAGAISELARRVMALDFRHIDPRSARILLIEAGPRVLGSFPEDLSVKAAPALAHLGVEVRTGARVENIDVEGVTVGGEKIRCRTVIWAAGVQATPAARWLGVDPDRSGRVPVASDLTVPGHPEIHVIGDVAHVRGADGNPLPGVAPVAIQEGAYVAARIGALVRGRLPPGPFRYRDKGSLATIGRSCAVAALGGLRLIGFSAWVVWLTVHIFYLIGFRNRIFVLAQWAWAYITFQRGARLITGVSRKN